MAPLSGSLMWACNNLRDVNRQCQGIKEELTEKPTNQVTTAGASRKTIVERPTFAADLIALQLKHPGLAGQLEEVKQLRCRNESLVYSTQMLQLLAPMITLLNYQEVAFYSLSSTATEGSKTVIQELDPVQPIQGLDLYFVQFVVEKYTRQDESALRTKVKCSQIDPSRAISIYLQTILHTPAFMAKFRFRATRLSFSRLSLS